LLTQSHMFSLSPHYSKIVFKYILLWQHLVHFMDPKIVLLVGGARYII